MFQMNNRCGMVTDREALHASDEYKRQIEALGKLRNRGDGMSNVVNVQTTRCLGMQKELFKSVYFNFFPHKTNEDFEIAWAQYEKDKAEHIRKINSEVAK